MKLNVDTLSKVRFGEFSRPSEGQNYVYLPMTLEQGSEEGTSQVLHFKTVKGRVASYDRETQVLCVVFDNEAFLQGLSGLNDQVLQHVQGIRSKIYGNVTEEEIYQIYRPFIIDRHVYFYAWNTKMVKKDGASDEENKLSSEDLLDSEIKCSFTIRGITLQQDIFGCALETDNLCVLKKVSKSKPKEKEPEPETETFSEDEIEHESAEPSEPEPSPAPAEPPSVFQGIVFESQGPKELAAISRG